MKEIVNDGFAKVVKPYMDAQDKKSREIIAPVEISPAEAPHSVGDQIIYNGLLYDVTAPIEVEDSLETSGAGANISPADNIEAQIKATKSQIQAAAAQAAAQNKKTQKMLAPVEEDETDASRAYVIGEQLILDGILYNVIDPIAQHGIITAEGAGANIEEADDVTTQLSSLNQTLTNKIDVLMDNGAVNLLPISATSQTVNGITFTVNSDGTITANGTATANANLLLYSGANLLKSGTYRLTGALDANNIIRITDPFSENYPSDTGNGARFTITSAMQASNLYIFLRVSSGQTLNNAVFKPMISDAELGLSYADYQLYAKTNRQLTEDSVDWDDMSKLGAVNLLPNNATTQTVNGITFTANSDGSITADGTATADTLCYVDSSTRAIYKDGVYKLSGCPSGGGSNKYCLRMNPASGDNTNDFGDGALVTITSSNAVRFEIVIFNGATVSNITFKPMLTDVSYNGDYVPYAKTNRELTEDVAVLSNNWLIGSQAEVHVTSDGTKTRKELLKELLDLYNTTRATFDDNVGTSISSISIPDVGSLFNLSFVIIPKSQAVSGVNLSMITANASLMVFYQCHAETGANSFMYKGQIPNGTITDEGSVVPQSGKVFYLYYQKCYKG